MYNTTTRRFMAAILLSIIAIQGSLFAQSPIRVPDRIITDYSKLSDLFVRDCDDLTEAARPSGEQLKRCLTISKDLYDRLTNFSKRLDELVAKLRKGGKWTAAFDEQFLREASRRGVDAGTVAAVKQAGGFRAFIEKSQRELKSLSTAMPGEIKELESKIGSAGTFGGSSYFMNAAYVPESPARFLRAAKAVAKVAYKVAVLIIAACEMSGGFCD